MEINQIQHELFRQIKNRIADQQNIAEKIAEVLDISSESAYRRMRGETQLDLSEAFTLCKQFQISMDLLMGLNDGKIMFTSNLYDQQNFDFKEYLTGVYKNMRYFESFAERKLYYECKDIPIFYHFHSRQLAAFKYYFWMKFYLFQSSFRNRKFSFDDYPDDLFGLGRNILHLYNSMPSVEFWNIESISSSLRQIRYFYETGCFTRKADVQLLYESLLDLIDYVEQVTENGKKLPLPDIDPDGRGGEIDVYHNEVILGSNMIAVKLGASQLVFLNHSAFNYAATSDLVFGDYIFRGIDRLRQTSTRISNTNEVERSSFFAAIREMIHGYLSKV